MGRTCLKRVLAAEGSIREVAQRFVVSDSYVARVRAKRRRLGQDTPGVQCSHVPLRLAGLELSLAAQVQARPDQTWAQLCEWAQREHSVRVGITAMWQDARAAGLEL